jgi:four helix bundle protein
MPTIKRFEDIIAWQKARDLVKFIFELTKSSSFSKDFKLVKQIRPSSGSIMDNIAEGFERGGNKEFIQFLFIAKGSLGELKSQLYRASDNNYINENQFTPAYRSADGIGGLLGGLINYLSQSDYQGEKYKDFIKEQSYNIII